MRSLAATLVLALSATAAGAQTEREMASSPLVVLAHDDTGDFGPATPGTRTAGWQEAIDYCVAHSRDLYVRGGWGGRVPIYHVADTIHIPATQDFRIDGGVYVVNWVGPADRDLLVVDSTMDGHYTFGILVYGGTGAALRIRPRAPTPIDGFPAFVDSEIVTSSIADPRPFERGERKGGAGVVFDTSGAAIVHNDFRFTAVLNFATCIETPAAGAAFAHNRVWCGHLHTNADNSTLLRLGQRSAQNTFSLAVGVDQGAGGVSGVEIHGANNVLEVNTRGGFARGRDLIFAESARGNQVNLVHDREVADLADFVTDRAHAPTNQVTYAGGPLPVVTVEVTAGVFEYTQRLYPAAARVTGGEVSRVTLVRGRERVKCGAPGGEVLLSVGDMLVIESAVAPRLQIIPLKVR